MERVFKECVGISKFLQTFTAEDEDGEVEGVQMCVRDLDDAERLVHIVKFRCESAGELEFHIAELKLGNPYKRLLVKDVSVTHTHTCSPRFLETRLTPLKKNQEVMVQELFDFFLLLQMISYNTPGALVMSPELKRIVDDTMGTIKNWGGEGEGDIIEGDASECEAVSTSEEEEDYVPSPPKRKTPKKRKPEKKEVKKFKRIKANASSSSDEA